MIDLVYRDNRIPKGGGLYRSHYTGTLLTRIANQASLLVADLYIVESMGVELCEDSKDHGT